MGDFNPRGAGESCQYVNIAAASTVILGAQNAYLERMTIVPVSTGAATVTISDGTTAILSVPAAAHAVDPHPYSVNLGVRAVSAGFKMSLALPCPAWQSAGSAMAVQQ